MGHTRRDGMSVRIPEPAGDRRHTGRPVRGGNCGRGALRASPVASAVTSRCARIARRREPPPSQRRPERPTLAPGSGSGRCGHSAVGVAHSSLPASAGNRSLSKGLESSAAPWGWPWRKLEKAREIGSAAGTATMRLYLAAGAPGVCGPEHAGRARSTSGGRRDEPAFLARAARREGLRSRAVAKARLLGPAPLYPEPNLPEERGGEVERPSTPTSQARSTLGLTGRSSKDSSTHLQPIRPRRGSTSSREWLSPRRRSLLSLRPRRWSPPGRSWFRRAWSPPRGSLPWPWSCA